MSGGERTLDWILIKSISLRNSLRGALCGFADSSTIHSLANRESSQTGSERGTGRDRSNSAENRFHSYRQLQNGTAIAKHLLPPNWP
jgi:hypothetical protein